MSWRCEPPVLSPVSILGLAAGIGATLGLRGGDASDLAGALCSRFDADDALLTDSGTSALVIAIRALVSPNGLVGLPAYGCPDLIAAALRAGVRVRLYDIDPATLSPDLESVRAIIRRGVSAIVVAHLYGYPADMYALEQLAAGHGIPLIEDAAQGAGGRLRGSVLGSIGDLVVLSFGRGKGLTGGSGGALLSRDGMRERVARASKGLGTSERSAGREVVTLGAQWLFARGSLYRVPASIPALKLGQTLYHDAQEPRSITPTAASILLAAMRMDAAELRTRRRNASFLLAHLGAESPLRPVRPVEGGEAGFLRCVVLDDSGSVTPRPELGAVRGYPRTLPEHGQLSSSLMSGETAGPGATFLRDRALTLPTHSRVRRQDVARLTRWMRSPSTNPTRVRA